MQIAHELDIAAPPDRVFAVYADPARVPEWRPSIAEVVDVSGPMAAAGTTFTTRYKGRTPDSHGRVVASDPPRRHVLAGKGAVTYEATVAIEPAGDAGSRLRFDLQVTLPGGPVGKVMEKALVRRKVERETAEELRNLKALVEKER